VNRRDLVQAVSTQTGVERKQVDSVLVGFTQVVTAVVSKGEPVSISGFAKFVKVDRPARIGRNPQTQEPVRIKASKKARITPLKGFKDAVVKTSLAPKLERGVWPPAPAAAKKTTAKKTTGAGTSTAKRSSAKKSTARKSTGKKATAKRATAKRATTRKSPARKTTARKTTAKKTTAKKATKR
jgi:DNA-binding protein HU-beta